MQRRSHVYNGPQLLNVQLPVMIDLLTVQPDLYVLRCVLFIPSAIVLLGW